MKKLLAGLMVTATALTPLTAAYAQSEARSERGGEWRDRAPRGPEVRQWDRRDGQAGSNRDARRGDDRPRGEWRQRDGRSDTGNPSGQRDARSSPSESRDRNRDGNIDRRWDRNRDGQVDRRWDHNNNGRVDRQWDRNRDGRLDQRWDYNRDGRVDRPRYDDRRYDRQRWNHGWRNDRRYNWYGHRQQYRDHYRLGRYYAPHYGHRYSRFSIGIRIGAPFYSQRYWINDPWRYRLPDVYGPYRWVRYYDDVLLVDIYSGQVVDVIYNFFW